MKDGISQDMWQDVLSDIDANSQVMDITNGKKWIQRVTSKFFEAQSTMSRHIFNLVKRMYNPLFERPKDMPLVIKKRLLQKNECMESKLRQFIKKLEP